MTTINEQNIRSYLERGESQTLEYKSGTSSLDAICKVVASFANAEGGILILGFVEPKGIVGVLPDRKLSTIDHAISHLNSLPTFTSYKVACDDKELIIIEVQKNQNTLTFFRNTLYTRVGDACVPMRTADIEEACKATPQTFQSLIGAVSSMNQSMVSLNAKIADYEDSLAKSDRKNFITGLITGLFFCVLGVVLGKFF